VSGQLEGIQRGAPYVLFGNGNVTRCNPIAKEDLAYFMMDSAVNEEKKNKIMNIGGPDLPLTNQMLAEVGQKIEFSCTANDTFKKFYCVLKKPQLYFLTLLNRPL
jgi:hypothetical protein